MNITSGRISSSSFTSTTRSSATIQPWSYMSLDWYVRRLFSVWKWELIHKSITTFNYAGYSSNIEKNCFFISFSRRSLTSFRWIVRCRWAWWMKVQQTQRSTTCSDLLSTLSTDNEKRYGIFSILIRALIEFQDWCLGPLRNFDWCHNISSPDLCIRPTYLLFMYPPLLAAS